MASSPRSRRGGVPALRAHPRAQRPVHQGAETVEKIGELTVILLFGSMLSISGLQAPGWSGWLLVPVLLLVIRPLSVAIAMAGLAERPHPGALLPRLVRRPRHRLDLLRGRRRRRRPASRSGDGRDRLDRVRLRSRLDRRPRHDRGAVQPGAATRAGLRPGEAAAALDEPWRRRQGAAAGAGGLTAPSALRGGRLRGRR